MFLKNDHPNYIDYVEGRMTDVNWFTNKLEKSKILLSSEDKEKLIFMSEILEKYFPGKWSFNFFQTNKEMISLSILYPEVKIENARRESHNIKNLIVYLDFLCLEQGITFNDLSMDRATYSYDEFSCSYLHSHARFSIGTLSKYISLNNSKTDSRSTVCMGNGIVKKFLYKQDKINTKEDFEFLILNIQDLVKWESIDGVPYSYISEIVSFSKKTDIITYNNLYDKYPIKIEDFLFDTTRYAIRNNKVEVIIDNIFISNIKEIIFEKYENLVYEYSLLVMMENNRKENLYLRYLSTSTIPMAGFILDEGVFMVGQNELRLVVEEPEEKEYSEEEIELFLPNPKLINFITNNINILLYEKMVKETI